MERAKHLTSVRRLVVKIGTRLTTSGQIPDLVYLDDLAHQLVVLRDRGVQAVLVVSGAVYLGECALGLHSGHPDSISLRQAEAAVGQPILMSEYRRVLGEHSLMAAQILLTAEDMADRARYLRIRGTVEALLEHQVIPIINENDSVSVEGVTFGENDRLAAIVAAKTHADALFLLSDMAGLHTADPRHDESAELISQVRPGEDVLRFGAEAGGTESRGGMRAKIAAAQMAIECGIPVVIAHGREEDILLRLLAGEALGTFFLPAEPLGARKVWIATAREPVGRLIVDEGARRALTSEDGSSLLPIGIVEVEGEFHSGEVVEVIGPDRRAIGRGIVNYSSEEIRKIKRLHSRDIQRLLGRSGTEEVIHRDNMVVTAGGEGASS
jgi:glutamate 5-kinase